MIDFFFPDSVDVVNPNFCFQEEEHNLDRKRIVNEAYPHEIYDQPPYDGMLISLAIVKGRYTMAQRQRLMRQGIRKFLRLDSEERKAIKIMGDCGAFSYRNDPEPPYSVDEVIEFYHTLGFDYGISLDHVILGYEDAEYLVSLGKEHEAQIKEFERRQQTTLRLAKDFLEKCKAKEVCFEPMGVAQGWSPASYAHSVEELQAMGYKYIALGGMVPLKTQQIADCLEKIDGIRKTKTKFHLLGISRIDELNDFNRFGVVSADSTAPLVQAFKSDKDNFHLGDGSYMAIRVPQTGENNTVKKLVISGAVSQSQVRGLEVDCMRLLNAYATNEVSLEEVLVKLCELDDLLEAAKSGQSHAPGKPSPKRKKKRIEYERTLRERPWEKCACPICRDIGLHVIIFRGAERNRRRGFHNLYNYFSILKQKRLTQVEHV